MIDANYRKAVRACDLVASTQVWLSVALDQVGAGPAVAQLADAAFKAVLRLVNRGVVDADDLRACYAEAAGLLRDGWVPGDGLCVRATTWATL